MESVFTQRGEADPPSVNRAGAKAIERRGLGGDRYTGWLPARPPTLSTQPGPQVYLPGAPGARCPGGESAPPETC